MMRRALCVYGLVFAIVVCLVAQLRGAHVTLMDSRAKSLATAIDVVDHGGPPLLGSTKPYADRWQTTPAQSYFAAGFSDDPGIYVYLPEAGHVLGVSNPLTLLKWFSYGSFALLIAFYPLLFYELFGSLAAAIFAPVAPTAFAFGANSDIYWIGAWCALAVLPVLMLVVARRWRRWSTTACIVAGVVASYASSIRSQAGLGVAIAALGIVLLRAPGLRRRLLVGAAVVLAYLSIRPLTIDALQAYRDHEIRAYIDTHSIWRESSSTGHPFWHSVYIGLGYLPNRWGIVWNDSSAASYVHRVDPTAPYLSPRYSQILEHRYFTILREDPGLVLRTYAKKAAVELNQALSHFVLGLVLLPPLLLFGSRRHLLRRWVLIVLPTLVIQFVPPVLTVPGVYGLSFIGAVGLLALIATCGALAVAQDRIYTWAAEGGELMPAIGRDGLPRGRAVSAGIAIVVLIAATAALHSQNKALRPGSATAQTAAPT